LSSLIKYKTHSNKTSSPVRDRLLGQSSARAALLPKNDRETTASSSSKDALIEMGDGELLQLQNRIIDQQDQQLDSLAQVLGRQKQVEKGFYNNCVRL
jgi:hypothetical protein